MKRELPEFLSDGNFTYKLAKPETDLGDGRSTVAFYEREPQDPNYQFTPCLDWLMGQGDAPVMIRIER